MVRIDPSNIRIRTQNRRKPRYVRMRSRGRRSRAVPTILAVVFGGLTGILLGLLVLDYMGVQPFWTN